MPHSQVDAKGTAGRVRRGPQPAPVQSFVVTARTPGPDGKERTVTAVTRAWSPGDAADCRLCPLCSARGDLCTVLVAGTVLAEEAPYHSVATGRPQPPFLRVFAAGASSTEEVSEAL